MTPPRPSTPAGEPELVDDQIVKALAHPLRQRILAILNRKITSPREVAEELGEKLGDVGYHFRMLRDYGAIELVRTEQRRGAIKHYYRATTRAMLDQEQRERLPASARRRILGQTLEQGWQGVREAAESGGFESADARAADERFELDERGYKAMVKLLDQTLAKAGDIQAGVIERRGAGEPAPDEVRTALMLLHFLPDGEPS